MKRPAPLNRFGACLAALLMLITLPFVGCSPYALDGKVVAGPVSMITVVSASDPRLKQSGLPGVVIEAMIDPDKLSREHGGSAITDGSGAFSLPIDKTGAGFLEYDVRLVAHATGFKPASKTMALPGNHRQLLIILAAGEGRYLPPKNDILQDTMDKSKPFLND